MTDKLTQGILAGSTDVSIPVILRTAEDGTETTGIAHGDVAASYWRQGATRTAISLSALTNLNDAHSDGGWKEADSANLPGVYRLDLPDAAVATGADWVIVACVVSGSFAFVERFDLTSQSLAKAQAELTGVPPITANPVEMIKWLFTRCRNRTQTTTSEDTVLKDDGVTQLASASILDDGSTLTRGEYH